MKTLNRKRSWFLSIMLITLLIFCFSSNSKAASEGSGWPSGTITIIVPSNPGGGYDLVARLTAPYIAKYLPKQQNVVVKNVPGAATRIGTRELVKSKPDGLTLEVQDPLAVGVMEVAGKLDWLETKRLSWVARLDNLADILLVGTKTGFKTPKDMKGKPVRFAGYDDASMFRSTILSRNVGANPTFVRYSGPGEAALAAVRGDLDAMSLSWSSGLLQMNANEGKIIALFVSSRVPGLEVPSAKEFGIEVEELIMDHAHALVAAPGLSAEVERSWENVFSKVFKDQEWVAKMQKLGYPASPMAGREKMNSWVGAIFGKMNNYGDVLSILSTIK